MRIEKRIIIGIIFLVLVSVLYCCDNNLSLAETTASSHSSENTESIIRPTNSVIVPTNTMSRTSTLLPSITPYYWLATPLPIIERIQISNADRIRLLAEINYGFLGKVVYSHNGSVLAAATSEGIFLFNPETLSIYRYIYTGRNAKGCTKTFDISPDGTFIASDTSGNEIGLWRISDGELLYSLENYSPYVFGISFSPDGTLLASGSWDDTVKIWQVSDGSLVRTIDEPNDVESIAFSPDGSIIASGYSNKIHLWKVATGEIIRTIEVHGGSIDITFSPDGQMLASGGMDNTIKLWRVSDGELLHTLRGTTHWIDSVAFSPDGTIIASGSLENSVRIWRVSNGALLKILYINKMRWNYVVFSPDGNILVLGANDGRVRFWGVISW
jgi:dipeptidyl aminopeptidase/acylaminoacyl peptidase